MPPLLGFQGVDNCVEQAFLFRPAGVRAVRVRDGVGSPFNDAGGCKAFRLLLGESRSDDHRHHVVSRRAAGPSVVVQLPRVNLAGLRGYLLEQARHVGRCKLGDERAAGQVGYFVGFAGIGCFNYSFSLIIGVHGRYGRVPSGQVLEINGSVHGRAHRAFEAAVLQLEPERARARRARGRRILRGCLILVIHRPVLHRDGRRVAANFQTGRRVGDLRVVIRGA